MNNNPQVEDGYTKIANEILDALLKVNFGGYERRVFDTIMRKTWGFNKKEDAISNSQICKSTGLHRAHVSRSLKSLIERNLVTRIGNKTSIQKNMTLWKCEKLPNVVTKKVLPKMVRDVTKNGTFVTKYGNDLLPNMADTKDNKRNYTKDTITKDNYANLESIGEIEVLEIAVKYQVPESFVKSKLDDMTNWLGSKGKKYKNYKLALMDWVKRDALQIKQTQNDRSKIAFINPK